MAGVRMLFNESVEEFDVFGTARRTLRQFLDGCRDLASAARDFILPNPGIG
jgi:hypothetical protein